MPLSVDQLCPQRGGWGVSSLVDPHSFLFLLKVHLAPSSSTVIEEMSGKSSREQPGCTLDSTIIYWNQSGALYRKKLKRYEDKYYLASIWVEVNVAHRLFHPISTHQDTLSILILTVIIIQDNPAFTKSYRVYHVHEISVGWIEPDKVRHSLEQQLSRIQARYPAQ